MIINSIRIVNIRSHLQTTIHFNKGITILSGRTGSGKSSVLMAITYALFGSTSNSMLLRRGAKSGFVELEFTSNGHEYVIRRGMKKSGERIIADPDNLWIKKDGDRLPLIARTSEINEKISSILGFPRNANARELFETTCYAKQDELRKLIELTNSEREKLIDRIMQLSKYELTYEHIKPLLNSLNNELSLIKGRMENIAYVKNELEQKTRKLAELKTSLEKLKKELRESKESLRKASLKREIAEKKVREIELRKSTYDSKKGLLDGFKKELDSITSELKSLEKPEKCDIDELVKRQASLLGEKSKFSASLRELRDELANFNSLGASCPVCKQEITKEHASRVKEELRKRISAAEEEISRIEGEISKVREEIEKGRKAKEVLDYITRKEERAGELRMRIKKLEEELSNLSPVSEELMKAKEDYKKANEEFIKAEKMHSTLAERHANAESLVYEINNDISRIKENLDALEKNKEKLSALESKIRFLRRIREDIRAIRSAVRARFLEDFRHEFQKKYEEIRPEGYSVDININYEPVAFAGGVETSISALSGGEKTSVALAYRLALSEISARINSISHNEFLMLDEPTTGFDRKDISLLPSALRNIRQIPQIIIVSHEEELKEAADYKYELTKVNDETVFQ